MTNKQLLEKMQEDMELRRIFKVHKVQLLSQMKRKSYFYKEELIVINGILFVA